MQLVFWYPCLKKQWKRRYGLLLFAINWKHPVHCCMGLIGVKSIKFSGNTLWKNSFVVPVLKRTNNGVTGYLHFQQIGLFSYPIHCCMGLFGIESITFFGSTLLRTCFASCVVLNGVNSIKFSKIHCLQVVLEYSCLKNQQIGLMCFYFLAMNWKVFGTKISAFYVFRILYIAALV